MKFSSRSILAGCWVASPRCRRAAGARPPNPRPPAGTVSDRPVRNGVAIEFIAHAGRTRQDADRGRVRRRALPHHRRGQRAADPQRHAGRVDGHGAGDPGPQGAEQKSCKDKISLYLKGAIGIRPMVDLNSYYVVLLNNDSSIAVVDPMVSMAGATSTLASLLLNAPGADWVTSDRERRLYISMPRVGAGGGDRHRELQGGRQHRRRQDAGARRAAARRALPVGRQQRVRRGEQRRDRDRHGEPQAGRLRRHRRRSPRDRLFGRQPSRLRQQPQRRQP